MFEGSSPVISEARAGAQSGLRRVGVVEHDPVLGQRGQVRRLDDVVAVERQGGRDELVGHHEQDVRPLAVGHALTSGWSSGSALGASPVAVSSDGVFAMSCRV